MDTEELRQLEGIADNPRQIEEPEEAETSAKAGPQAWVIVCVGLLIAIGAYFVAKPLLAGSQKKPQKQETAVEQQQHPSERERQLIEQENERKFKDILQAQQQGKQRSTDAIKEAADVEQQGEADAKEQQKAPQTAVADNRVQQQQQPRTSRFRARPSRTIPQRRRTTPPVQLGRVETQTQRRSRPQQIPALREARAPVHTPKVTPAVLPTGQPTPPQEDFQTYITRMRNYASFSGKDNYTPPTGDDNSPTLTEVTNLETLGELQPLEELKPLELIGVGDGDTPTEHQAQAINIGQTFKAEIVSGVAWSTEAPLENQTVLAQLKQGMGSLPKGTFLSLAVTTASSNGLVSLTPQAAQIDGQSIPLPESLRITAPKGKPLIAKRKQSGGGFGLKDVLSPVLGAARSGATFINRTRSASTISTQGISQATTDNSQGSVIAALGGGFADQILQRAQQQAQAVQSQRTPYYLLPIGKTLEITVIQDVQI